jgi:hypothetical protein
MSGIKLYHVAATMFLALCGFISSQSATSPFWLVWLLYAGLLVGLLKNNIWCARLLALPPLLVASYTVPFVLYNFYAFVSGHPRYQDSPGTILVVFVQAVLASPSAAVLFAYWSERNEIFGTNIVTPPDKSPVRVKTF